MQRNNNAWKFIQQRTASRLIRLQQDHPIETDWQFAPICLQARQGAGWSAIKQKPKTDDSDAVVRDS
eukprot:scaffold4272_cov98-Cylindrotheca_fusiformis.AAC.4